MDLTEAQLREELVILKVEVLRREISRYGLKAADEAVSEAAMSKIEASVAALAADQLGEQIAHWRLMLSKRQTPPKP